MFGSHFLIWKYDTHPSNSLWDIRQKQWTMKYRSQWHMFIFSSNFQSYWPTIPKDDVHTSNSQDITQNHWTMIYKSQWPTFILRSWVGSYCFIIPNNDVHSWNSLQATCIRHNHWTTIYRSQWPTFILRSWVRSYCFIIPNNDIHSWNSLQATVQVTITGPWNIGHSDLHLFWGQTASHTDSYPESMMYIHQIVFKI